MGGRGRGIYEISVVAKNVLFFFIPVFYYLTYEGAVNLDG